MPTTQTISVSTWAECENKFRQIREEHAANPSAGRLVFRGQSNSDWSLQTTLERHIEGTRTVSLYYRDIKRIKPEIESYTSLQWDDFENRDLENWAGGYDDYSMGKLYGYEYLVYLRHHGFPSPLLDWSKSPYIASYFAFAKAKTTDSVAIFFYSEPNVQTHVGGSDIPVVHLRGEYIRAHRRHFRQQSCYTTCASYDTAIGWMFVPHQTLLDGDFPSSHSLSKIIIPGTLKIEVLSMLDRFNLNAFTLFETDDSLMETLAFRQLKLNPFTQ